MRGKAKTRKRGLRHNLFASMFHIALQAFLINLREKNLREIKNVVYLLMYLLLGTTMFKIQVPHPRG